MPRYITSTAKKFTVLPCIHEGQFELAEHSGALEIACLHCGATSRIPKRCECKKRLRVKKGRVSG